MTIKKNMSIDRLGLVNAGQAQAEQKKSSTTAVQDAQVVLDGLKKRLANSHAPERAVLTAGEQQQLIDAGTKLYDMPAGVNNDQKIKAKASKDFLRVAEKINALLLSHGGKPALAVKNSGQIPQQDSIVATQSKGDAKSAPTTAAQDAQQVLLSLAKRVRDSSNHHSHKAALTSREQQQLIDAIRKFCDLPHGSKSEQRARAEAGIGLLQVEEQIYSLQLGQGEQNEYLKLSIHNVKALLREWANPQQKPNTPNVPLTKDEYFSSTLYAVTGTTYGAYREGTTPDPNADK